MSDSPGLPPPWPTPGGIDHGRRWSSVRWDRVGPVLAIAALLWTSLAAWALASPVGSSPDDGYHIAMIYCTAGEVDCIREGTRVDACYRLDASLPATCEGTANLPQPPATGIITGWYPPLYYATTSLLVADTVGDTTILVRLFNVTLAVALTVGSVVLTRPSLRGAVTLSWLVASVPLGVFLIASINPSAWAIMGVAACWGPLLSFLTTSGWGRLDVGRVAFVQVSVLLALGSRSETPVFIALTAVATAAFVVTGPLREATTAQMGRLLVPVIVCLQSALALVAFTTTKRTYSPADGTASVDVGPWQVLAEALSASARALVDPLLGWLDTPVPEVARAAVTGAWAAAVIIGLATLYAQKVRSLLVFCAGMVVFPLVLWAASAWPSLVQPRYFLPLLFVLVGLALLPRVGVPPTYPTRLQGLVLAVAIGVANALSLLTNLVRYVSGLGDTPTTPGSLAAAGTPTWWWPWLPLSPTAVWLLGSAAFAAAAVVAVLRVQSWTGRKSGHEASFTDTIVGGIGQVMPNSGSSHRTPRSAEASYRWLEK